MASVGFTAGRDDIYPDAIISVLKDIGPDYDTFITGGARGGDAIIGKWLAEAFPNATHKVFLATDQRQTDDWWNTLTNGIKVKVVDPNRMLSYRDRNQLIVQHSDILYGFPAYPENHSKSKRSGTWQTIRMAQRKSVPYVVFIQNELEFIDG